MNRRDFLRMIGLGCLVAVLPTPAERNPFCDSTLEISQDGESWTKLPGARLKEASVMTYDDLYQAVWLEEDEPYRGCSYAFTYVDEIVPFGSKEWQLLITKQGEENV